MAWRVRAYRPGDEAAVVAVWNRALCADPMDEPTFCARVLADANFSPAHLLVVETEAGDRVAGFLLYVLRRVPLMAGEPLEADAAWITAFGVDPADRRCGAGSALFAAACAAMAGAGVRSVEVSTYAPGYFWPGVDAEAYPGALAFLQARGFSRQYEAVAMDRSLSGYAVPPEAVDARRRLFAEGLRLEPLSPPWVLPLIEWNRRVFAADWARAVREAVASGRPFSRTLLAVQRQPEGPGRLLGFAQYGCYDRSADRFGPFGVDPSARRRGIGACLLHATLRAMQVDGLRCAWFLWTGEDSPAGALYRRAGFHVSRRFVIMRRRLDGAAPAAGRTAGSPGRPSEGE